MSLLELSFKCFLKSYCDFTNNVQNLEIENAEINKLFVTKKPSKVTGQIEYFNVCL